MPDIELPVYMERVEQSKKRYVVLIGGRGSAKSASMGRMLLKKSLIEKADVLNGREFQKSIEGSVHKLYKNLIRDLDLGDFFHVTKTGIDCIYGNSMAFNGFARNPDAIKSAEGFKYSWMEEAQTASEDTLTDLLPTIRMPGAQLFFTANPKSSSDPFSKRFIVPFLKELLLNGFYEDELHLIVVANWRDNPWHGELEAERLWDFQHKTRALYDHIWEGAFNDSIESPLILAEWFDACVDAHVKLGIKPSGMKMCSHDPSDIGPDSKGYAYRHGSVIMDVQEKIDDDINVGADWACDLALRVRPDVFTWDCDGMGVTLNRQIAASFEGKLTKVVQFKGSKGVHMPDAIFDPAEGHLVGEPRSNKDTFKNQRAQWYFELRKRIRLTWESVTLGKYVDPSSILSFDSSIKSLEKLRSELCRMPIKPNGNGLFELYTKEDMKRLFKMDSPNLGDSVMMLMKPISVVATEYAYTPKPIRSRSYR